MNYAFCSDGTRVSQATIDHRLSESYHEKYWNVTAIICECCGLRMSTASDHTIAKARCKTLHKTELIWNPDCYVRSCDICHKEWEGFKSGEWTIHLNVEQRLIFLKEHDPEGFNIRIELTKGALTERLTKQIE